MKSVVPFLTIACFSSVLAACVFDDEPPRRLAPDPHPAYEPGGGGNTGGSTGDTGNAGNTGNTGTSSPSPMLVEIDTDQTMSADPGQGVGVFVEYAKGGHWHVWWTCDTAKTRQSCEFSVSASVASGNITNVDGRDLAGGFHTTPTSSRVEAKITTTNQVHGLRFDTNAGAVLTLDASVGGLKDGAFLFFVQNGKVNGGWQGKVTNPLQLQGNVP
jgi:hypothetical protein